MSTTPGPDEKVCPFCAEIIRAAAVKCRYCHSDLPAASEPEHAVVATFPAAGSAHDIRERGSGTAAPETAPETAPDTAPDTAPEPVTLLPGPTIANGTDAPVLTRAVKAMLVACLVLALGIAGLFYSARPDDLRTAGNGEVTSDSYRSAAMSAAAANASAVLSYGYKTLAADEKAAREVLTPGFAEKYAKVMEKAGPKATKSKLTLKATVASTAVISLKKGSAKMLLFVNTITTAEGSKNQQLNQNRVLMTMTRTDGDWVVSKLTPF